MKELLIIIEKTGTGFSAYVPDLPGVVATGSTKAEVKTLLKEAVEFHLEGLKETGGPVPELSSESDYVAVAI